MRPNDPCFDWQEPSFRGFKPKKNTQNSGFHSVQGIWYHPSLILEPHFFLFWGGALVFFQT